VDALHIKASDILEVHNAARSRAFSVFLVDLPDDLRRTGTNRKCTEKDLEVIFCLFVEFDCNVKFNCYLIENEK
jgi:hypothetical protein